MKLSSTVDRATISPLTWDYNQLDEAVVAETIVVGDDTYHLVIELDGGHGVPLVPFAKDVQEALTWAYFGAEGVTNTKDVKKKSPEIGFWKRFKALFSKG